MNREKRIPIQILVGVGIIQLVVIFILLILVINSESKKKESLTEEFWLESSTDTIEDAVAESTRVATLNWVVDVKGAVVNPGIYDVEPDMRVQHVINLAGGFLAEAETSQLNLSQIITDQMMIYVPLKGELLSDSVSTTISPFEESSVKKVNINKASDVELQVLPGIGEKKAAQIVAFRNENGSYTLKEDLMNVNGIGQKTFDGLKDLITISD